MNPIVPAERILASPKVVQAFVIVVKEMEWLERKQCSASTAFLIFLKTSAIYFSNQWIPSQKIKLTHFLVKLLTWAILVKQSEKIEKQKQNNNNKKKTLESTTKNNF